jgi:hypothetical protein
MTRSEFFGKLNEMFGKHPMIAKSNPKTLNELMYVLRMEGDRDYAISTNDGSCIPSVRETFVPVKLLSKKILSIDWHEEVDEKYGTYNAIIVNLK